MSPQILVGRLACLGLLSAFLLQACVDSRHSPTPPSPLAVDLTGTLSWACGQDRQNQNVSGWTFLAPGCPGGAVLPLTANVVPVISGAPTNFRPTVNGNTVRLDWNAVPELVTSHLIEAGSAPGLANLAVFNTASSQTFVVVVGVPNGVFYVRVRAVGPDGIPGPASNEIVVRVGTCSTAPGAPGNFTHTVAGNTVNLFWNAPTSGDPPTTFILEAGSASGLANILVFNTGNAGTSLTAFAPNGIYFARIRAQNPCGVSGPSNEQAVVVGPGTGPTTTSTTATTSPSTSTTSPTTSPSTTSSVTSTTSTTGSTTSTTSTIGSTTSTTSTIGSTTSTTSTTSSTTSTVTSTTTSTAATVSISGPTSCSVDDARGCSFCQYTATTNMTGTLTYTWSVGLVGTMTGNPVRPDWRTAYCPVFNGGGSSVSVDMTVTVSNTLGHKATSAVFPVKIFTT